MVDQPYAQGCRHTIIAGFGKLPSLVCLLGQTIPASFDYMHILVRTHGASTCSNLSRTNFGNKMGDTCRSTGSARWNEAKPFFLFQLFISVFNKNILNNTMCNYWAGSGCCRLILFPAGAGLASGPLVLLSGIAGGFAAACKGVTFANSMQAAIRLEPGALMGGYFLALFSRPLLVFAGGNLTMHTEGPGPSHLAPSSPSIHLC